MGLDANDSGGFDYEPIPEDSHLARCIGVIDLGTQHIEKWNNWTHKVLIMWELPNCRLEFERDGEKLEGPRVISREFTMSLSNKAHLRKFLQVWRGKPFTPTELEGFNVGNVLGQAAVIVVLNNEKGDKVYSNVESASRLMKGQEVSEAELPLKKFDMDEYNSTTAMNNAMDDMDIPEWIQKKVQRSREYENMLDNETNADARTDSAATQPDMYDEDDDIPF